MKLIAIAALILIAGCSSMTTNTAKLGERTAALEARVELLEQDSHKRGKP